MPPDYLRDGFTAKSWLLTTDHKRIALLYLLAITFFFFLGASPRFSCGWNCSPSTAASCKRKPTTSCSRCTA